MRAALLILAMLAGAALATTDDDVEAAAFAVVGVRMARRTRRFASGGCPLHAATLRGHADASGDNR